MINKNYDGGNRGNGTTWAIVISTAIVLAGLFMLPRLNRGGGERATGAAPCLVPNLPMTQHIHPRLRILLDNKEETVPANIGIGSCERALHTHDASGEIHVEAQDRHEYTLGEFFATWGKPLARDGYLLEMTVDGVVRAELGMLKFKDKQNIVLQYKRVIANNANGGK